MTHQEKQLRIVKSLKVLADIADAYDSNGLDDEARKHWGPGAWEQDLSTAPFTNKKNPRTIELYSGRGGRQLLTLQDCLDAREILRSLGVNQ